MGEVVGTLKLMPESPDEDLAQIKADIENNLPEGTELHKIEEEPIAFGLVALNVMVVVDDGEGGTEPAEAAFAEIKGVSTVEVTDVRRLM